jgi:hypothetical protein
MRWLLALVVTITACASDESLVDELARYRDAVCACGTGACVEALHDQDARWRQRFIESRRVAESDKATRERIEDLLREIDACKRDVAR